MITAAVALAGMTVVSAACAGAPQQQPPPKPSTAVVAEVDGQAITLDDLEKSAGGQLLNLSIERR